MPVGFTNTGQLDPVKSRVRPEWRQPSPGPGHYDPKSIDMVKRQAPRSAFGAYSDKRFRPKKTTPTPSPDQYNLGTTCGPLFDSSFSNPVIPKMTKAQFKEKMHRTPGPSDYRAEQYKAKNVPTAIFGGELAKVERFGSSNPLYRKIAQAGKTPGPSDYSLDAKPGIRNKKCPGAPLLGTARRFRGDPGLQVNHGRISSEDNDEEASRRKSTATPGPGQYGFDTSFDKQMLSSRRNTKGFRMVPGTRSNQRDVKSAAGSTRPRAGSASVRKKSKPSPGPTDYDQPLQWGGQANSLVRTSPMCKFGTAARAGPF